MKKKWKFQSKQHHHCRKITSDHKKSVSKSEPEQLSWVPGAFRDREFVSSKWQNYHKKSKHKAGEINAPKSQYISIYDLSIYTRSDT